MSGAVLLDETHDPRARSWLDSANRESGDFPIQNLPFAIFRRAGSAEAFRGGVAIGDQIIDLAVLAAREIFQGQAAQGIRAGADSSLNSLMQLGPEVSGAVRHALFEALLAGSQRQAALQSCLVPQSSAQYSLPAQIGDYTDFYASIYHATAVGRLMRPDKPLLPNYEWIPIGYHGRSSSIEVSGQTFHRPRGQRLPPGALQPVVGASTRLDYELELGVFIGGGNSPGMAIPIADAEAHIFGMCLLNDWSARDLQTWEYQPLGPFLAKNFATTISPWIVTLQALAPFRVPPVRPESSPPPLPYLSSPMNREAGAFDIRLEALLQSEAMRAAPAAAGPPPVAHQFSTCLLDHRAIDRAPHRQWLQLARRRSAGNRDSVGTHSRRSRLIVGVECRRQPADSVRGRDTYFFGGRRQHHSSRLV